MIVEARAAGFRSVSLELRYGAPKQTLDGFSATLDAALALGPDRLALHNRAHVPASREGRIDDADLPSAETRLQMLTLAVGRITRAGYLYIGMNHFAQPDDELAVAQRQGRLQRSLEGYSTRAESDLLGVGIAAIGRVGPTYYQNLRDLKRVLQARSTLDGPPIRRGIDLTQDDLLRRAVIEALSCHFRVSIESLEVAYLIDFRALFRRGARGAEAARRRRIGRARARLDRGDLEEAGCSCARSAWCSTDICAPAARVRAIRE